LIPPSGFGLPQLGFALACALSGIARGEREAIGVLSRASGPWCADKAEVEEECHTNGMWTEPKPRKGDICQHLTILTEEHFYPRRRLC
jgi:hypothetical protein